MKVALKVNILLTSQLHILPVPASVKLTPTSWQLGVVPSGNRTIKELAVCVK